MNYLNFLLNTETNVTFINNFYEIKYFFNDYVITQIVVQMMHLRRAQNLLVGINLKFVCDHSKLVENYVRSLQFIYYNINFIIYTLC